MGTSVRIVFEPLYMSRNTVLVALKVDYSVMTAMPATAMPNRNPTMIVAATCFRKRNRQRFVRTPFVQILIDDSNDESLSW